MRPIVYSERPPVYSGRSIQRAFDGAAGFLEKIELSASDGTIIKVSYAPLVRCIEVFAQASGGFRHLLRKTILSSKCCSLTLVWYNDGVTPGNVLSPDPLRKSVVFYASFLEFGHHIRSEYAWFPLGVIRESVLKLTRDGLPGYFTSLVKTIFPPASSLMVGGEPFTVDGEVLLLRLKGMAFVADEGAIKTTFEHKGASGLRCCIKCKNVVTRPYLETEYLVHQSEHDFNKFDAQTDQDLFDIADFLSSEVAKGTNIARLETFSGLNYTPSSIFFDAVVRSYLGPSRICYDAMHVFLSNGILGDEISLLCKAIKEAHESGLTPISVEDIDEVVAASWHCADSKSIRHSTAAQRSRCFKLALRDKCSASGLLCLFPLLDFAIRTHLMGFECLSKQVESFLALCSVVRQVCRTKLNAVAAKNLQQQQSEYMSKFVDAYGKKPCKPKHHWQFHVEDQVETTRLMLDCFSCERKRRGFKSVCEKLNTNDRFETSVLCRLIGSQSHQMSSMSFQDEHSKHKCSFDGISYHRGDVVILNSQNAFVIQEFETSGSSSLAIGVLWNLDSEAAE